MKTEFVSRDCTENDWEKNLRILPGSHFLQSPAWAHIKAAIGWRAFYKIWLDQKGIIVAGAMVLERRIAFLGLPIKYGIHYVPKGPLLNWENEDLVERVLEDLESFSISRKSIFLKIDPDLISAEGISDESDFFLNPQGQSIINKLVFRKWIYSLNQIQFKNTVWIDLKQDEADLLAGMKQKTRYNIRLAERKGVKIRVADPTDFPKLYEMYINTSLRDNFTIRPKNYYLKVWKTFYDIGQCEAFIAEFENTPIAGLFLYYFGEKAYYVYGMSTEKHRNLMPSYLLQWEAIKAAKRREKSIYDLWGAPYEFNENDSMWGVFKFKQGLGGKVIQTIGAWDYPSNKFIFWIFLNVIPKFLGLYRAISKRKLKKSNEGNFA
jgi:lipid II:glycine glycyltransferase (peptidoglycan interpeptide bridge formation enzyme)